MSKKLFYALNTTMPDAASPTIVDEFYMMRFNNSDKIPTKGKYKNNDNARIINEYNLMNNNCVAHSVFLQCNFLIVLLAIMLKFHTFVFRLYASSYATDCWGT